MIEMTLDLDIAQYVFTITNYPLPSTDPSSGQPEIMTGCPSRTAEDPSEEK